MTPEERQMLGGLFQRVNSAAATQRDPEAESFISDAVRAAPHAPYVLAQTVLVQQQALEAAANRISELERLQGPEQNEEQGSFLGNLGKSIFGGGPSAPPRPASDPQAYPRPPPPSRYAPQPPQGYPPAAGQCSAPTRLSASATWPVGPAPAFERRRLPAKRSLNRDGRGRRRCPWQSAGRPVWRPWRRSLWRRGKRRRTRRLGPYRQQSDRDHGDQQLLRRRERRRRGQTPTSSSLIPARRASRTRTSTSSTIRPSTFGRFVL